MEADDIYRLEIPESIKYKNAHGGVVMNNGLTQADFLSQVAGQNNAAQAQQTQSKNNEYGKTIGDVKLSDTAKKYYDQLKKKYSNMDFILVSEDQKSAAQANASAYANTSKTVVLIDTDKIEKMATDENYRKKYESVLSGATSQLEQLKNSLVSGNANVKGYGIQVNDGGTASFFAVVDKSQALQKKRIEKKAEHKAQDKKVAEKKAQKEKAKERLDKQREAHKTEESQDTSEYTLIQASSVEELMKKLEDMQLAVRSDSVKTQQELLYGQNIDYKA